MKWLRATVLLVVFLVVVLLAALAENQQAVHLQFAIWQAPAMSMYWWMLAAFASGGLFGLCLTLWNGFQRRLENRRLRQELTRMQAEVERLKDLTLQN